LELNYKYNKNGILLNNEKEAIKSNLGIAVGDLVNIIKISFTFLHKA